MLIFILDGKYVIISIKCSLACAALSIIQRHQSKTNKAVSDKFIALFSKCLIQCEDITFQIQQLPSQLTSISQSLHNLSDSGSLLSYSNIHAVQLHSFVT